MKRLTIRNPDGTYRTEMLYSFKDFRIESQMGSLIFFGDLINRLGRLEDKEEKEKKKKGKKKSALESQSRAEA